jgi:indole-3-acetate monooxygenase
MYPKLELFRWCRNSSRGPTIRVHFIDCRLWAPLRLAYRRQCWGLREELLMRLTELALTKTPVAASGPLRERSSVQIQLGQAEAILRSGRLLLLNTVSEAWRRCLDGGTHSLKQRVDLLLAMTHAMSSAAQAVELCCRIAGTAAFRATNPLERCFRDVQTMRHHVFASEARYGTFGQVYLGVAPDFPVVAF